LVSFNGALLIIDFSARDTAYKIINPKKPIDRQIHAVDFGGTELHQSLKPYSQ
jgi:hypothetical protein